MATSTTTIRPTTTTSGVCAEESGHDGIFSFPTVYNAYVACRRRKRNTANALKFEVGLLDNLYDLVESLSEGAYKPFRSVCFITGKPKLREIFAADFRDRVVHHLLVPELEKIFEPKFIHDSYACRKNRGTHAAIKRLKVFMNRATKGGRIPAWYLQLDVRSFFMSIDKAILLEILGKHVKNETAMEMTRTVIEHDCTEDYIYKGSTHLLDKVPSHKSLFGVPSGKGLPIGNLTSQFFANVYLNELDQYVKHTLKVRYYLRYVDDFILLGRSRDELICLKSRIEDFLARKLALTLKPEFTLKRVSDGADFLGYIVRPGYVLVRNRVVGNLRARLDRFRNRVVVAGAIGRQKYNVVHLREETVCELRQTPASYLGHFKHANAYKLVQGLFEKYPYLKHIFAFDFDRFRLVPLYEPPFALYSLRGQHHWFTKNYLEVCVFFQVGRFFEFYGPQTEKYAGFFGLKDVKVTRGMGRQCGFPVRMLRGFKKKALRAFQPYIVVGERGYYHNGIKRRVITEKLVFEGGNL